MVIYNHCKVPNIFKIDGLNLKLRTFANIRRSCPNTFARHCTSKSDPRKKISYTRCVTGLHNAICRDVTNLLRKQNESECALPRWLHDDEVAKCRWHDPFFAPTRKVESGFLQWYSNDLFTNLCRLTYFVWLVVVDHCFQKIIWKRSVKFYIRSNYIRSNSN